MSQDSDEIKTIEQWKWSEMQGLELVPEAPPNSEPCNKSNYPTTPPTVEEQRGESKEEEMEASSEPKRDGGGALANGTTTGTSTSGGGGGGGGEKVESVPSVGFGELFRFADGLDYILMAIGTVGAIVHGCSLPLFLRFFADLVNSFGSNANNVDKMTQEVVKVINQQHNPKFDAFL